MRVTDAGHLRPYLQGVREGHALGSERAWNGHFTLSSFRYIVCSLLFSHHINTSALDPSRVSERLEPSHGDSPRVAWSAATVFIASRASYHATVQVGQAGPFYFSFSLGHRRCVLFLPSSPPSPYHPGPDLHIRAR